MAEHLPYKQGVAGPIPARSTKIRYVMGSKTYWTIVDKDTGEFLLHGFGHSMNTPVLFETRQEAEALVGNKGEVKEIIITIKES